MINFLHHFITILKSTFRNFQKHRLYSSLNIAGLAIAFATLILIVAYLYQETSYESFYSKADRIYRPTYRISGQNNFELHFARVPVNYINQLPAEIPEIEKLIRFQNQEQKYVRVGDKRFKPKHAYSTDADIFELFDLAFVEGAPATALSEPNAVVLTETVARKYFSRTDVLGEELMVSGNWSAEEKGYRVTGVIQDVPVNTHLPIEMLFSFANESERTGWAYVYTLLAEGAAIAEVNAKLPDFISQHTDSDTGPDISFDFQALPEIHLQSHLAREIQPNGQLMYIKIFFWVGLFVWLIALVNFTNLSTALSMGKGKEVGIRKVLGASRRNLILLSMSESITLSLIALCIGGLLAYILFPAFSNLTGISMTPPLAYFLPALLGLAVISGLLAGILPSLMITSIQLLQAIKQGNNWSMNRKTKQINAKRVMITLQFCATIILIGGALVAHQQFKFINNKNLGLQAEQILAIPAVPKKATQQYTVFKNRLKTIPGVREVSACMQLPSTAIRDMGPVLVKGINEDTQQAPMMDMQIIDPDFIEMMDLSFLAGADFTAKVQLKPVPEFGEDLSAADYLAEAPRQYLLNETAMKLLGWQQPEEAIGQEVNWSIGSFQLAYGPVAGVIKDYHQESLKTKVDPLILAVEPLWLQNFLIKVETQDLETTIAGIENVWNDLFPYALEYEFLDELYNGLYQQDRVQLKLLSGLAVIAIVISFLGLISLVAYALKRRSRELAIRRVIGANLLSLISLIGKEYFWVLAIAAGIGIPVSYYWVSAWLQNFAYHIDISPLVYGLAILLVYTILGITIYLQTLRATVDNPVQALGEG